MASKNLEKAQPEGCFFSVGMKPIQHKKRAFHPYSFYSVVTLMFLFTFASYVLARMISVKSTPVASDMVSNTWRITIGMLPETWLAPEPSP